MISWRNSWIFCCCHCFVSIVINLRAYCLLRFLNFEYILQIFPRKSLRLASSNVSVVFLHIFMIDLRASSWIWSAEYLLMLVYYIILFVRLMNYLAFSYIQISSFSVILWNKEKIFWRLVSVVVSYFYSNWRSINRYKTLDLSFMNSWYSGYFEIV